MDKKITTTQIVGTGLLLALEIIFQIVGNYLQFGPVNINLSLITIVLAAVLYGPLSGAIVGFFNGLMALLSPSTLAIFMPISPIGTVLACLLKTTLAGLVAGFIFKLLKNKNEIVGLILAAFLVPIINTGLFALFSFTLLIKAIEALNGGNANLFRFVFLALIGWNFIFEFSITLFLSTTLARIIKIKKEQ